MQKKAKKKLNNSKVMIKKNKNKRMIKVCWQELLFVQKIHKIKIVIKKNDSIFNLLKIILKSAFNVYNHAHNIQIHLYFFKF